MIEVGTKEQIYSTSFAAKDHEVVKISFPIASDTLRMSFQFLPNDDKERDAVWIVEDGMVKFTIVGWRNPLGTCITEPAKFADAGDRKIYLQLAHYLVGKDNNLCHVFIYLGAPND